MTTCFEKNCSVLLSFWCALLSLGFESEVSNLIVLIPDHCLSLFTYTIQKGKQHICGGRSPNWVHPLEKKNVLHRKK